MAKDGFQEWWVEEEDGRLVRWIIKGDNLVALVRHPDGPSVLLPVPFL